jgi:hypothetical protein
MNNFFEKKNVEKLWWYGLNILTTLFIVSFVNINAPQGPAGSPGSNGVNGVDGQDGQNGRPSANTYPVHPIRYDAAPVGAARAAYAQALVEEGFIPISSIEDLVVFTQTDEGSLNQGYYGNQEAFEQNYVLTADLDFFGEAITEYYAYRIPGYTMREFNREDTYFNGIFDGAGYTIRNFELNLGESDQPVAFIPRTDEAIIRNITFENHKVTSVDAGPTGGVVGRVEDATILQNITLNNLEVYSDNQTGGVVGRSENDLYLLNVKVNLGSITGGFETGGLVGLVEEDHVVFIQDSVNRANLDYAHEGATDLDLFETRRYGGLVGRVLDVKQFTILDSANFGDVNGLATSGGLVGMIVNSDRAVIANSYNAGFVGSNLREDDLLTFGNGNPAGGLIGSISTSFPTYIQNSYNAGQVFSYEFVGGLIGEIFNASEDSYLSPSIYITNAYNAGYISTMAYSDGHGGLVGVLSDDDNRSYVVLQNAFNVSQFSKSITRDDLGRIVRDNGAIIGDTAGVFTIDNVRYFVDLDDVDNYVTHALDQQLDHGVVQSNDISDFTAEAFYLADIWDFDTIWTFATGDYVFPVLQKLPVVLPAANRSFDFHVDYVELYEVEVEPNAELGQNEIVIKGGEIRIHHVDVAGEEMLLEFYGTRSTPSSLDDLQTNGELFHTESSGQSRFIDGEDEWLYYAPTLGDGDYFLYVVAYDDAGNYVMVELYIIAYTEGDFTEDTEAPVPGNGGALSAAVTFFPDEITFTFVEATDNITSQENLGYVAVVAQSGFDFTTWNFDPEISEILGYNEFTNLNIAAGSYVFEDDFFEVDFNTRYEVALFVYDEAYNFAYYQTTFVEYID